MTVFNVEDSIGFVTKYQFVHFMVLSQFSDLLLTGEIQLFYMDKNQLVSMVLLH